MIELNSDDFAIFLRLGILFFEEILSNILECSSWTVNDIFDFKTFWADWAKMVGHGWAKVWKYLMSYILVQKSVWRRSESRVGLASKRQVWSTLKLFEKASLVQIRRKIRPNLPFWIIWITCVRCFEIGKFGPDFSPNLDQTCLFEQFENGPNLPFPTCDSELLQTLFCTKI